MILNLEFFKKKLPANNQTSTLDYWQTRAKKFGKQAVISIDHPLDQFEEVRNRDKNVIFPFLKKYLTGKEKLIMDFGCGVGRFTSDLAKLGKCKAVGVDPTEELIKLAPKSKNVTYYAIKNGEIPLEDRSVDVIWIYAVLGCIKEEDMKETCRHLARVLKQEGIVIVIENTTKTPDSQHYYYRSAKKYIKMLDFASLQHLYDYFDEGKEVKETFSIMAGKKKSKGAAWTKTTGMN